MIGVLLAAAVGFVEVQGAELTLDGRPFHFVGANLRVMHGEPWRTRYVEVLDAASRDGLAVGRVWALGEGERDAEGWRRKQDLFRAGPDGWIEEAYLQLDRVLVAARARGIRLIVTLSNHWKDYGGAPQYLRWAGIDAAGEIFGERDRFYTDPRIRAYYAAHIERLLSRKNSIDGTPYVDEPAILSWELMNESQVETPEGALDRRRWIQWAAALIKTRDRNHLVAPGLVGYTNTVERDDWIETHKLPEIDYCDAHLYPKSSLRIRSPADLDHLVDDQAQLARHVIQKPLVIGEFGFPTRAGLFRGLPPERWFGRLLDRARLDGAAGALAWIYQPRSDRSDEYAIFIDDERAAALRRTMAEKAARLALPSSVKNPRLSAARGKRPLFDFHVELPGRATPLGNWRAGPGGQSLDLPATEFARAYWEHVGTWEGGELVHAYGARTGYFDYRFRSPRVAQKAPTALELRVRLSSEYPGALAPPDGYSHVQIRIDGVLAAELDAIPDDGRGRFYTIRATDAALLRTVASRRIHTLRIEVPEGPSARGVSVYGLPGKQGREPAEPGQLRWLD